MADEEENAKGPFWTYFQENSPLFRELCEAKLMVANDKNNDKDFSNNRPVNTDCSPVNMNRHAQQFRDVLAEIDTICGGFIRNNGGTMKTFLDICCAPGGFTKYILEETVACGMGVTLPVEQGGHPMIEELVSPQYTRRFYCVYQDIIDAPLDITFIPPKAFLEDSALQEKPGCDFVIMGGMYQGNKPWLASQGLEAARQLALAEGRAPPVEQPPKFTDHNIGFDALLVAQMIIALNNLAPGGTLMLTVNCNGNVINCSTICLLRGLFQRAHSAKVRVMHAHRGTFRMVFQGYDPAAERQHSVLDQLCSVLDTLKAQTRVDCLDVPGVSSVPEMVERFGANVQKLYEPVWAVQLEALRRRFPGTFGLGSGRPHGRSFREPPGRSSRFQNGGTRAGESGEGAYENGHRDSASTDKWGKHEAGPSRPPGAGQREREGHWGRDRPFDHGQREDGESRREAGYRQPGLGSGSHDRSSGGVQAGRIDAHGPGEPPVGNGSAGPRKGSYVPPHARSTAARGDASSSRPNRTPTSRW